MSASIGTGTTTGRPVRNLTPSDIEHLGAAGGWQFFRYPKGPDGSEYVLANVTMASAEVARPPGPGELRIAVPRVKLEYGTRHEYVAVTRADKVQTGSYAAALERDAKSARQLGKKPHRPVDLVARLVALRPRPDYVVPAPARVDLPGAGGQPVAGFAPGTAAASGPAAIVDRLRVKGVALSLTPGGRLLVTAPGGNIADDLLAVVIRCERLLAAHLSGRVLLCELAHDGPAPEAVTVLAVDVPACADCAAGREAEPAPEVPAPKRNKLGRFLPATPPA